MLGIDIKQAIERYLEPHPVTWSGKEAQVCEGRVQLPALVDDANYSQRIYNQMVGYGLHELGHICYTDEAPWDWATQIHGSYLGHLINGLEDVRIEKNMIDAGVKKYFFEAAINASLENGYVVGNERKDIPFLLAVEGRRLNGYRLTCQSILDETPWSIELWRALKQVRSASSTGAVVSIALRLYRSMS